MLDSGEKAQLETISKEAFFESAYRNYTLGLPPILSGKTSHKDIRLDLESDNFGLTKKSTDFKAVNNLAVHGANSMLKKPRRRRTAFTQVRLI